MAAAINIIEVYQIPHLSKRFTLKRFLKLTEEEIYENEKLWAEENKGSMPGEAGQSEGLGSVGAAPMPSSGFTPEPTSDQEAPGGEESPISGAETPGGTEGE